MLTSVNPIVTAIRISPYYCFHSTYAIANCYYFYSELNLSYPINLILMTNTIGISTLGMLGMRGNLIKYNQINKIMNSRGYSYFHFSPHLQSLCGRRILKAVAKDNHFEQQYKQHLIDRRVRWHQFDPNPFLNILYPSITCGMAVHLLHICKSGLLNKKS